MNLAGISGDFRPLVRAGAMTAGCSSWVLNVSEDGDSTTSLGSLFLCVTTLIASTMFWFFSGISCVSVCVYCLSVSGHHWEESVSAVFTAGSCIYGHLWVPPELSLLQAEWSQLSQPLLTCQILNLRILI